MMPSNGAEGYLQDVLDVTDNLLKNKKQYDVLKASVDEIEDRITEARRTGNKAHMLALFALFGGAGLIISAVLFIIGVRFVPLYAIILLVLPAAAVIILRFVYKKKILEPCEKTYNENIESYKNKLYSLKGTIIKQKLLYETLVDRLNPECRHSLAIFIMKQAAKDGVVNNVFRAQEYENRREKFIMNSTDEETKNIAGRIEDSKQEEKILNAFLENLGYFKYCGDTTDLK